MLSLVSDGSTNFLRLTQASTGFTPKAGDKIFTSVRVNFKTTNFLKATMHIRDWVTGGTFDSFIDLDVTRTNSEQELSLYTTVTNNFVDQLRFYIEGNLTSKVIGEEMTLSKPILLNLTQIFGVGNEPSQDRVIELLKKFGGWFDGNVTEFVTKQETKIIASDAESKASSALNKVDAITNDMTLNFQNMIINGNFSNTDFIGGNSWKRKGIKNTNAKNFITTFVASKKEGNLAQTIQANKDHIYYIWAQVKSTSKLVSLMVSANVNASMAHSGSGNFEFLSCKHIRDNDSGINVEIRDKRESGWDEISVKYVGAMDLTEIFGAGNEPEVYEMDVYIKKLRNMWFDGEKDDLMSLDEINKHFKNVERKNRKLLEFKSEEKPKYVERIIPKTIMTITYDDECSSIYDLAFPIHQSENVNGVFYVVPSRIGTRQIYNYGVADEWNRLRKMNEAKNGRIQIEHHTYAHWTVNNVSRDYLTWMIERSNEMFWRNEIYPKHLSYPGGFHDFNAINVLQDYVQTGVTTTPVVNGYDLNPMRIHRYGMDNKTLTEIKAFIDNAVLTGGWLVTYQHGLSESGMSLGGYQVQTPQNQLEIIQYAKSKGVEFVSLDRGLEMYAPQTYIMKPDDLERPSFSVQRNGIVVTT